MWMHSKDTTEKSEQLNNKNVQSQENLDKSTKESTLQKPTRRSARKGTGQDIGMQFTRET